MIQFRLVIAVAALTAALPAAAMVKVATYTGTLASGIDETGVFAAAGTDLSGYGWTATFTYNKALGGVQATDITNYDVSYGGTAYGNGSPIINSTITINGVTKSISGAYFGYVLTDIYPLVQHYSYELTDDRITARYNTLYAVNYPAGAPASLDQDFGPVAAFAGEGSFNWQLYDYATDSFVERASGRFGHDMTYSVRGAVPEPETWALMIGGFALAGMAMRRQRRANLPA